VRVSASVPHARPYEGISQQGSTSYFRHPVFGNRENWVSQATRPYAWPAVLGRRDDANSGGASTPPTKTPHASAVSADPRRFPWPSCVPVTTSSNVVAEVPDNDYYRDKGWEKVSDDTPTTVEADLKAEGDRFLGVVVYDPSAHSVEDVQAYLADAPEAEVTRVLQAERDGKARKTILGDEG
jgi:hypothetical protein